MNATVRQVEDDLIKNGPVDASAKSEQLILAAKDILVEWLDYEKGSTVTEMSIFSKLADRYVTFICCYLINHTVV